ncbi:unnamed protein product, partial [Ascophyllum nodosum]
EVGSSPAPLPSRSTLGTVSRANVAPLTHDPSSIGTAADRQENITTQSTQGLGRLRQASFAEVGSSPAPLPSRSTLGTVSRANVAPL